MQIEKLPELPNQRWNLVLKDGELCGIYESASDAAGAAIEAGGSATAIFTAQQVLDYALATRKAALEEAAAFCEHDSMIAVAEGYERFSRYSAECAAKIRDLMEKEE